MAKRRGGGRIRSDLPPKGSEEYEALKFRKKELAGQAVEGKISKQGEPVQSFAPRTTLKGKGGGASAAMRKRLDKVKI